MKSEQDKKIVQRARRFLTRLSIDTGRIAIMTISYEKDILQEINFKFVKEF